MVGLLSIAEQKPRAALYFRQRQAVAKLTTANTTKQLLLVSQPERDYPAELLKALQAKLNEALRPGWFGDVQVTATVKNGRLFEFQVGALPSTRCTANA